MAGPIARSGLFSRNTVKLKTYTWRELGVLRALLRPGLLSYGFQTTRLGSLVRSLPAFTLWARRAKAEDHTRVHVGFSKTRHWAVSPPVQHLETDPRAAQSAYFYTGGDPKTVPLASFRMCPVGHKEYTRSSATEHF